jgi:hypothetical protein
MGSCLTKNSNMDDSNSDSTCHQNVSRQDTELGRNSGSGNRGSTSTNDNTLVETQSHGLEPSGMTPNMSNSEETRTGNLATRTATTNQPSLPRPVHAFQTKSGTRSSIYGPFNPPSSSNTRFLHCSCPGAPTPVPGTCSTAGSNSGDVADEF